MGDIVHQRLGRPKAGVERALCAWRREAEAGGRQRQEGGSSGEEVRRREKGDDSERGHLEQR